MMINKFFALSALAMVAVPSFASDLWDQQAAVTGSSSNIADTVYSDLTTLSSYDLSSVTVGGLGWNVTSFSELFAFNTTPTFTTATLNILAGGSSLPTTAATSGQTVSITTTATSISGIYDVTATVSKSLAAGSYWIGLTPTGSFSTNGEGYAYFTSTNAAGAAYGDAWTNPGGGFGYGSGYESLQSLEGAGTALYGSIDIQGTTQSVPEPLSMTLLGIGTLGLIGRRRK